MVKRCAPPQSHGRAAQRRVGRPDLLGTHVGRTAARESAGYDEYTSVPRKVSDSRSARARRAGCSRAHRGEEMHGTVVPHARGSACVAGRQRHDERAALANHAPGDEHVAAQETSELPVWRYATRLLASNAAVATYGLARPRESTFPETDFRLPRRHPRQVGWTEKCHDREQNLDGDPKRPRSVGKAFCTTGRTSGTNNFWPQ